VNRLIFILIFTLTFISAKAQDFIGLDEQAIRSIMSEKKPELIIDKKVRNTTYRYLKYYSKGEDETWIIFIDENGKCNGVRITCDNNCLNSKIKELNSLYRSGQTDRWFYRSRGEEISIILKQEKYFFTVTYEPTQQRRKSGDDRAA
jgi:hypothetical protein